MSLTCHTSKRVQQLLKPIKPLSQDKLLMAPPLLCRVFNRGAAEMAQATKVG